MMTPEGYSPLRPYTEFRRVAADVERVAFASPARLGLELLYGVSLRFYTPPGEQIGPVADLDKFRLAREHGVLTITRKDGHIQREKVRATICARTLWFRQSLVEVPVHIPYLTNLEDEQAKYLDLTVRGRPQDPDGLAVEVEFPPSSDPARDWKDFPGEVYLALRYHGVGP